MKPEPISEFTHDFKHNGKEVKIIVTSYDEPIKKEKEGDNEMYATISVEVDGEHKTQLFYPVPITEETKGQIFEDAIRQIDKILEL
jgi:hypothetical protein